MKLQPDAHQDYQLEAIHAVVSLFEGQPDASQISVIRDSVFFVDRVANYRIYCGDGSVGKGKFAAWFEEIYGQYRAKDDFAGLMPFDARQVHNGCFSQDKKAVSPFETVTGKTNAGAWASVFEPIMRDKERLLDIAEPLAFIFSHSALREGWDNPNVFQICTLAEPGSEIKKRQEIGRGLRLRVKSVGNEYQRVHDRGINRLTVIANESYEDFANQLQGKTGLAKPTVARIPLDSGRLGDAVNNPQAFVGHAAELTNAVKREFLVFGDGSKGSGVKYIKHDNAFYEIRRFEACEDNDDVLFYIKLPRWFKIETPVGAYNPDWAIAYHNDKTLYFLAETRKTGNGDHVRPDLLRPIEALRIERGRRHFKNFEQVLFKVVSSSEELVSQDAPRH